MMIDILNSEYHYTFLIVGSMMLYCTYFLTNVVLNTYNERYMKLDENKKMYVVSNILKSMQLCGLTPLAGYLLYNTMYLNHWNSPMIKNLGIIYTIPDTVSLILVKKMDITTKVHHGVVCLFNIASINNDYTNENILRCLIIYAAFSTYAFLVNFMLGVRFLHDNKTIEKRMSRCAFAIYASCCIINWGWHYFYVLRLYNACTTSLCTYGIYIYSFLVCMIAIDDIKLNKWLFKKSEFLVLKAE